MIVRKTKKVLSFQKVFVGFASIIIIMIVVYHNMLTYQFRRIISQRMYVYGYNHQLLGNLLQPNNTFGFHKTLYEPQSLKKYNKKEVYILILVSSSPHNQKHKDLRDSIRNSWGNCSQLHLYRKDYEDYLPANVRVTCQIIFFMGKANTHEQNLINYEEMLNNNDLIIGDFYDSYHNMTRKLLFALNWSNIHFKPHFILKTDDDVFINVPKLIYLLNTKYAYQRNMYGGHIYYASVVRDMTHRHYLTREEFPNDWYPPYNKGSQLILSGHLLNKLLWMSTKIKRFQIDDAYIGIVMNHIGVLPTNIKEFVQNQWVSYFVYWVGSCELKHVVGIGDDLSPGKLEYIHKTVHSASSWFCIRIDYLVYYLIFMTLFFGSVLLCCRERYCPWLTFSILSHSVKIFYKKLRSLK